MNDCDYRIARIRAGEIIMKKLEEEREKLLDLLDDRANEIGRLLVEEELYGATADSIAIIEKKKSEHKIANEQSIERIGEIDETTKKLSDLLYRLKH